MQIKKITVVSLLIMLLSYTSLGMANHYVFNPTDSYHTLHSPIEEGLHPAILMLHASGGVEHINMEWAELLTREGYVVYIIDSFTPRGYTDRKSIGWDKATSAQLADIEPAFRYLIKQPNVDANRIGLLGFSMGGYDTLRAMQRSGNGTIPALQKLHFRAAASFYGVCKLISPDVKLNGPLKIFTGANDDRATTAACEALINKQKEHDASLFITTYPQALHGFDNSAFPPSQELTDEKGDKYHIGFNQKAKETATHDLLEFFNHNLKK